MTIAPVVGDLLLSGDSTESSSPPRPLSASVNAERTDPAARGGDPVIVASGEGVLVRATNLPGDQESTEIRVDESGRIVVPREHLAYFRVNLSVAPVAPVQLVVYQEWAHGDGGHRYAPANVTLFEHSREVEADWDTVTCVLPEGRFDVRLIGPLEHPSLMEPPRHVVHYRWEGEGELRYVGVTHDAQEAPPRCLP